MSYKVSLNNNKLAVSLSRTGGQGSKGDSVTSASIDSNGDFHVIISDGAGNQVSDTNLGGANIVASATTAATNAQTALDTFDDRFLGAKSSAPTVDNDGDALITGALFFNTTTSQLGVYNGTSWEYPALEAQTSATSAASSLSQINTQVSDASASATAAANSATSASSSATSATSSATSATSSKNAAASSASNAATSESNASTSATNSAASASSASTSATNAATSATNASTSATSASNSATTASGHKDSAATSSSSALSFRDAANTAATNAAASESAASTSATSALASKNAAASSEASAATSASSASTSATNAANSATSAATSATSATSSASNAASSASSASSTLASVQTVFDNFDDKFLGTKTSDPTVDNDGNALVEGAMYYDSNNNAIKFYNGTSWEAPSVAASNSATAAATSATAAGTSETNAATYATNSSNSATAAASSATAAAAAADEVDDIYLGAKTGDPSLDNDGDALVTGALYFNSNAGVLKVYNGSAWVSNLTDVVNDTTPQLGGNLDANGNSITSASGIDINITPGGGGAKVVLAGLDYPNTDGSAGQFLKTDGSGNLSFGTVSSDLVGDTTPQLGGALDTNSNNITFSDSSRAIFGAGSDLQIYHDGTDNHIDYSSKLTFTPSGGADLSFNGTSYDTDWMALGHWHFKDGTQARFGNADDLTITHDGSNSYITESGTGNLIIKSSFIDIKDASNVELISADATEVRLRQGGNIKLITTSSGIRTYGTVNVNGAYTLPTSDGSANYVLTTNGSGVASWAAASGSDPDLYRDNASSATTPSATGSNAVAIGNNSTSSGNQSVALGGSNASGFGAFAFGLSSTSSSTYSNAFQRSTASGQGSFAAGSDGNNVGSVAAGTGSMALATSYASGNSSFAAAITNNTNSYGATNNNTVSIGNLTKATSGNSVAIGLLAQATNSNALAMMRGLASGQNSIAIGYEGIASAKNSVAIGRYAKSETQGKYAFSNSDTWGQGKAQSGHFILKSDTTDATAEALTTNRTTADATNQVVLPNNSVYGFTGTVIAREDSSSTNDFAVWEVKGGAVRAGSASTTALGSYNINKISESTGAANWSIALSADTTNGAVAITVTGEASHNIRWVATINTTEVIY
jgi:hypothetical protein